MLGRRSSLLGELAEPPQLCSREFQVLNSPQDSSYIDKKVKLPCLMSHQVYTCGIIYGQSAITSQYQAPEISEIPQYDITSQE
jgi:hypothetical protein